MQDISRHEFFFESFFTEHLDRESGDKEPLSLKYGHSLLVLKHVRLLAETEEFAAAAGPRLPLLRRAALLAALYHDIARFPQYARWRTFSDKRSTDHGRLGVKTLKKTRALDMESAELRRLVQSAVVLHNRYRLPDSLPDAVRLICAAVRDADKLDICRVFAEQLAPDGPRSRIALLGVKDDPALYNPKVAADALAGRVASYADLLSVNDFRLLLGTWQYDLHFAASRGALAEAGALRRLLEDAPALPGLIPARRRLLADLAHAGRSAFSNQSARVPNL